MKKVVLYVFLLFSSLSMAFGSYTKIAIRDWLVLGPFSSGREEVFSKSFINEESVIPVDGEKVGNLTWKKVVADQDSMINFLKEFGMRGNEWNQAAYACAYIYSDADVYVKLNIASDDGNQVWVNGMKVWQNDVYRAIQESTDRATIFLGKGLNRVLIKVTQLLAGWEMRCTMETDRSFKITAANPDKIGLPPQNNAGLWISALDFALDKSNQVNIKMTMFYNGKNKIENAKFSLGKHPLTDLDGYAIMPGIANEKNFTMPVADLAMYMTENPMIKASFNKTSMSIPLLPSDLLNICIVLGEGSANPEIKRMSGAIRAMTVFMGTLGDASLASQLLSALSQKQDAKAQELYKEIYTAMLGMMPDYSGDKVHVVGHAHIDMNWLWPYPETKKIMLDNIRQAVAFMDEYPDFTMLQSQATIYQEIEKSDPPLFKKVQKYVAEGRFEPVGGTWTEGDCNLSSGEAICRTFLLGQQYFLTRFGKIARVGWFPDNFSGHPSQVPQILKLAGCEYLYFMRCKPPQYKGTFWWMSPDSSRILCYTNENYNGTVTPGTFADVKTFSPEKNRILAPTGVGDHGGGPTRRDINNVHMFQQIPKCSGIQFTTAENFFNQSKSEMDGRLSLMGEMRYHPAQGCLTSVAEIKEGNRNGEHALYQAELMASLGWLNKSAYPAQLIQNMWELLAFNEFHDILPGTAIYETYKKAASDHERIVTTCNDIRDQSFREIAGQVKFSMPGGQPVVAFNMHPFGKSFIVEAEVFSNEKPVMANANSTSDTYTSDIVRTIDVGQGKVPSVLVKDAKGKIYPAQVTWIKMFPPGYRMRVLFVADDIPAGGYKTFYVNPLKPGTMNDPLVQNAQGEFETKDLKVKMDMKTGDISSMMDKRTGMQYAVTGKNLHRLEVLMENNGNAWGIGKIDRIEQISDITNVNVKEQGPVRACIEAEKHWGSSKIIQRTYIYRSYPRVDVELEVHWFERSTDSSLAPFLKAVFPLALTNTSFDCHQPFDVVTRPADGADVSGQQWADVSDGKNGLAVLNTTKYAYSYKNNELALSLLRTTHYPDRYPNIGTFTIRYSLYPHKGDWKNGVWNEGDDFNIPVYAAEPPSLSLGREHATRPEESSFISIVPASIVLSAVKQSEDEKELIIRVAEVEGKSSPVTVNLPVNAKAVRRLNVIELPLSTVAAPVVTGHSVTFTIKPHEIVTLGVTF